MTPPGTENSEGHSEINIPPIIAAHIGVSSVNDAVLTDESFVAPIPNKRVGSAVEITPKAIKYIILLCNKFIFKVELSI